MSEENKIQPVNKEPTADETVSSAGPFTEPETLNIQPLTIGVMETHAQELHKAPGRGWKHYFFEFFMLFLAVFCGFLAENYREHQVEHGREKQYIRSMIEDLKSDTSLLNNYLENQSLAAAAYDSVILLLPQENKTAPQQKRLYYLARIAIRFNDFPVLNDNTYEQMKSSGNLRLLQDQNIADSISSYYSVLKEANLTTRQLLLRQQSLLEIEGELFDGSVLQNMVEKQTFEISEPTGFPKLITDDKKIINKCIVALHYLFSLTLFSHNSIQIQFKEANSLIVFLKKEYHFD